MRAGYLIPVLVGVVLALAGCGGPSEEAAAPAAEAPAAPAVPAPTLVDLPSPWNEADLAAGAGQFAKCHACHSLKAREGNLVGPNLHGVFERKPGTAPKFRYSAAVKNAPFEQWTPELVDQWLQKPSDFLPGTSMFFNGITKPDMRRDLIAYLLIETRK
ncbi:MAG TPA: c-type cytochrome [Hyphomonadaceae bacterium]|jgi:cytochrome c|nr:c-type cytochrome [Hyphomonadaceae bacterium]